MNATAIKLVIKFWHDDQPIDPNEWDGWKAYSFSRRHGNSVEPYDVGFEDDDDGNLEPNKDLRAKLKSGLAFMLDYYEHGQCAWSLSGEGTQCQWDTSRFAGLLVWEHDEDNIGAKTVEDRRKDATAFINRYTLWCNGEIYGYTMEAFKSCGSCGQDEELSDKEAEMDLASCGGYYSDDFAYMLESIKENIGDDWADYEVAFKEQDGYGLADEAKRLWKGETK